jgi:xylan 1,4-beta-xylosidase
MIQFRFDLAAKGRPLVHHWEHCVGSGRAVLALRADWQAQLAKCRTDLGVRHVRFHGILSDDMGTLVIEQDEKVYSFLNADRIFDFLVSIGMKPLVELSFMPRALASGDKTVFSYKANVTPPRNLQEWTDLVDRLVRHWVDRFGIDEVATWPLEVWNEPNLEAFWTGGKDAYLALYDDTARTIKAIDARLQVGGPATAANEWIEEFVAHCETRDAPLDFVSTHLYPTDAFGSVTQDTIDQLARSERGWMREQAQETRRHAGARPVFYTEWSSSSNPRDALHDESYAAAFETKTALDNVGIVDGSSLWTFSDIFEENYFPSVPFHGGFGLLTLHAIAKPSYSAFQLLRSLGDEMLQADGAHNTVDAWAARASEDQCTVVLTNHALPKHAIETQHVRVSLQNGLIPRTAFVERIDETHCNPKRIWQEIGSPEYLSHDDVALLDRASRPAPELIDVAYDRGTTSFEIALPPHAVAFVRCGFVDGDDGNRA